MSIEQLQRDLLQVTGARRPRRRRRLRLGELAGVWLIAFGVYTAVALVATLALGIHDSDAMRRAVDVWQVWEGEAPTAVAINAEYPPLQTLLALLPAALPPARFAGIAVNLVSAAAGAAALAWLYGGLRELGIRRPWRMAAVVATGIHPMMLLYAANGASDMLYAALLTGAVAGLIAWRRHGLISQLIQMGGLLGLAFLVRYEALIPALTLLGVIYVATWQQGHRSVRRNAALMTYGLPVIFMVGLWLWLNFLSFGDLFRFGDVLVPSQPDLAADATGQSRVVLMSGDVPSAAGYLIAQGAKLAPLWAAGLLAAAGSAVLRRSWLSAGLLVFALAVMAGPGVTYVRGLGYAPLRDLLPLVPLATLMLAEAAPRRPVAARGVSTALGLAVLGAGVAAALVGGIAMRAPDRADEWESVAIAAVMTARPIDAQDQLRRLAQELPDTGGRHQVIADDLVAFPLIYFSGRSADFYTPSESRYARTLAAPAGKRDYLLLQAPTAVGTRDTITQVYPTLYYQGGSGFELERGFDAAGWRLYRIVDGSPNT